MNILQESGAWPMNMTNVSPGCIPADFLLICKLKPVLTISKLTIGTEVTIEAKEGPELTAGAGVGTGVLAGYFKY